MIPLYLGTIQTSTGRYVAPLKLHAADVDVIDIAHALSNQCRFSGHVRSFYAVGDHSVRVSRLVSKMGGSTADALWGLLHDASEAYLVDLPRPLKHLPGFGEGYRDAEIRAMRVICSAFHLPIRQPDVVHEADEIMLHMEKRDLMPKGTPWNPTIELPAKIIQPLTPDLARRAFLRRYRSLVAERTLPVAA